MNKDPMDLALELCATHQSRKAERAPFDTQWQQLAEYFCPRKSNITGGSMHPDSGRESKLYDGSGYYALDVAVRGQTADIIPHDQPWFTYDPPAGLAKNFRVQQWAQECTRIARAYLGASKFYAQGYEFTADRTAFGTACFYSEEGSSLETPVVFRAHPIGSYTIAENADGHVDCIDREFRMTARQLVEKFGKDKGSDKVRKAYEAGKGKQDLQFTVLHCVYPRSESERMSGKRDGVNKPYASVYLEAEAKHALRIGGFDEMPYSVSRWSTWEGYQNSAPYGYSPAWLALPDMRQLNFLQKQLDALAEKKVTPPMLIPVGFKNDIDVRAGGITWFDPTNQDAKPTTWGNEGEYQIGERRAMEKRQSVEAFFQVNMWLAITRLDRRQVTAEEVRARVGEQARQFGATYTLLVTEWLTSQLLRFFRILLRRGLLPPPPQEMVGEDGQGGYYIPEPDVIFSSRIAMALRDVDNTALSSMLGLVGTVAQWKPDITDAINWDQAVRDVARNRGIDPAWNRDPEEVEAMRAQRAEQQQQMMQAQQAEQMAGAAAKIGGIPGDSALMSVIGNQ
jgi:hypothetical protein